MRLSNLIVFILIFLQLSCGRKSQKPPEQNSAPDIVKSNINSGNDVSNGQDINKLVSCRPVDKNLALLPYSEVENPQVSTSDFETLAAEIQSSCASCHGAPNAAKGGFRYLNEWGSRTISIDGVNTLVPGLQESAEKIFDALNSKRMPPNRELEKSTSKYDTLKTTLKYWIDAGKPVGIFATGSSEIQTSSYFSRSFADLGECIPNTDIAGTDSKKDDFFESLEKLPEQLSQTDLFTLDNEILAKHGTFSYTVEYPLWADNAEKGRYIHLPAVKIVFGKDELQAVKMKPGNIEFDFPENTRFYKTFYKAIRKKDETVVYRKIETRLIVVRKAPREPLLGTYQWNDAQSEATLVNIEYRDGTPWKDKILKLKIDEASSHTRTYAIPGKQRCVDCHKSTSSQILGFTPLQLNRRKLGEAGRDLPVYSDELNQVNRLIGYGVLGAGAIPENFLKLDSDSPTANIHALKLQGYIEGNCVHCHNPKGFAMKDNDVKLDFSRFQLLNFDTRMLTKDSSRETPKYIVKPGNLNESQIYQRVNSEKLDGSGGFQPMPMHTPGDANCRLKSLTAKWILSLSKDTEIAASANSHIEDCEKNESKFWERPDFHWLDVDLTWPKSEKFVPRRSDWNDLQNGMPQEFRDLVLSSELLSVVKKPVPTDFWERIKTADGSDVSKCNFPVVPDLPTPEPWMLKSGKMKQPASEIYSSTPGAYFYSSSCAQCHGKNADGKGGLATNLVNLSGGSIRVASFSDGLFGNQGKNLNTFDTTDVAGKQQNLAGNYLIWMAMKGTKVNFPEEFKKYVGSHQAQMLNRLRDRCKTLIETSPQRTTSKVKDFNVFNQICFVNNGTSQDPELQYDANTDEPLNRDALERWADRAAYNIGWAIFDSLSVALTSGTMEPQKNECEKKFPLMP